MKRILLFLISLFLFSSVANATSYFAVATGNWSNSAVWALSSGGSGGAGVPGVSDTATFDVNSPSGTITISGATSVTTITETTGYTGTLAFGSQTLTVSNGATLFGAMTSSTGTILLTGGGVTLSGTPTGPYPTIKFTTAGQTLTSGGFTWPGAMNFDFAATYTLVGNWINTGLTTCTLACTVNLTTAETLTLNGGLTTNSGALTGTAGINLNGGTWSGVATDTSNITIAGNVTVSGQVGYSTGTLTYSSGTVTTTESTLVVGTCTLNTNGITWNIIQDNTTGSTVTMGSNLASTTWTSGTTNNSPISFTIAGAHAATFGTFKWYPLGNNQTFTFPASQTLTINTSIQVSGDISGINGAPTIKSGTSSTAFNLNYAGSLANMKVSAVAFTDVNAAGSAEAINNYNGGTLTRTTNITNVSAANFSSGLSSSGYSC